MQNNIKDIPFNTLASMCSDYYTKAKEKNPGAYIEYYLDRGMSAEDAKTLSITSGLPKLRVDAYASAVEDFCTHINLKSNSEWVLPQMLSTFANSIQTHEIPCVGVFDESNTSALEVTTSEKLLQFRVKKYSPKLLLDKLLIGNTWMTGLYRLAMHSKRGDYLRDQYKDPGRHYCALVPLILAAFKKYHNIQYSEWLESELHLIVDPKLHQAMTTPLPDDITQEEIITTRDRGLLIMTGARAGTSRGPLSTSKLSGIKDTRIGQLPELAQTMLTQTWCAHPSNRTNMMVLDPRNWDTMPAELVQVDIFANLKPLKPTLIENIEAPWYD